MQIDRGKTGEGFAPTRTPNNFNDMNIRGGPGSEIDPIFTDKTKGLYSEKCMLCGNRNLCISNILLSFTTDVNIYVFNL